MSRKLYAYSPIFVGPFKITLAPLCGKFFVYIIFTILLSIRQLNYSVLCCAVAELISTAQYEFVEFVAFEHGFSPTQALATTVIANKRFTWSVPYKWTLEQAATVPVAYTTAYYSLVVRGRIKRGDKVLIQGGSGGVGQAAIAVAFAYGCEVFTTTSSEEKKNYLQTRFPQLKEQHFSSSRNIDFEQHIMESTDGRGVDVVLNSLSEDKLQASVHCLAQHGRFLEIGKFDLSNNSNLGMSMFLKNVTLMDSLFENQTVQNFKESADAKYLGTK